MRATRRAKRRLPAWSTLARSASARGMSSPSTGAPSSFTPALGDHPTCLARREAERRGDHRRQVHGIAGAAADARAPRRGRSAPATTRVKCASASRAASSPCERRTMNRASSSFASIGSRSRAPAARRRASTSPRASRRGSASSGRTAPPAARSSGMLFPTDELIFAPSQERRSGVVSTTCGLEAVRLHDGPPGEQVVELVGAAELDVRLDRDRVVGLHQRVEELRDRDRLARGEALARSRPARGSARPSSCASGGARRRNRALPATRR